MNTRKNPKLDVYRHSGLFFQIGLLLTMSLVVGAFQWESNAPEDSIITLETINNDLINVPVTIQDEKKLPPKPKKVIPPRTKPAFTFEEIKESADLPDEPAPNITIDEFPLDLPVPEPEAVEEFHDYAEIMPEPEDGYQEFYNYLARNIRYPRKARELEIEGKVYVRFIINRDGSMSNVEILKGIGAGCDEEVLRVFNLKDFPAWKEGRSGGLPARVRMALPVYFRMN